MSGDRPRSWDCLQPGLWNIQRSLSCSIISAYDNEFGFNLNVGLNCLTLPEIILVFYFSWMRW